MITPPNARFSGLAALDMAVLRREGHEKPAQLAQPLDAGRAGSRRLAEPDQGPPASAPPRR